MAADAEQRVQSVGHEHDAREHQRSLNGHSRPEGVFTRRSPQSHSVGIGESFVSLDLRFCVRSIPRMPTVLLGLGLVALEIRLS